MITKFNFSNSFITGFIKKPGQYSSSTPEGAILRAAYTQGIKLRKVTGGWVEYDDNSKKWVVYKVCAPW
ncbi:hypothetical protein [Cedecea lapagei]|uniref:hypothetical protein n=1 Tax=Cedecea lapagei TaxID=158823 RepID=UPI001BCD5306|nr:hypothetical protein [Cedecea lapagei]